MSSAIEFLRRAYFFRNLPGDALEAVAAACVEASLPSGTVVFHEGEPGDRLFILLEGRVELWKGHETPREGHLVTHGPGRVFGEMALVDNLPRSATAIAVGDVQLLWLSRAQFHDLVRQYPELALSIMKSLSAIVRESNDSFVNDLHMRNRELENAYARLEEAQRELLLSERFSNLGKMANLILHDIRNPVSVMRGYAAMLHQMARDPESVHDVARRITMEADRLAHLSGELLDYARGEVRLDLCVVAPSHVARSAIRSITERYRNMDIALCVEDGGDSPVVMDRERMVRVLLNLLENARKACRDSGNVTLEIARTNGGVAMTVRDTGEGMPQEMVAHVFEPFVSLSREGGTGLGLVVVRSIVEAHGGTVVLTSRPGEGTEIRVELPGRIGHHPSDSKK